jgi:phosphatidylserine decarboxylase
MVAFILILIEIFLIGFAIWYYKRVWFYRNPSRIPPKQKNVILSPADGDVVYIKKFKNNNVISEKLGEKIKISEITKTDSNGWPASRSVSEGWIIGIYMKPTDVHFNYSPLSGSIKKIVHKDSKLNLPMVDVWEYINFVFLRRMVNLWSKKFHLINERNTIFMENKDLKLALVEIADKFVNKIDCFVKEGDSLKVGQKVSFIKRGSQVDLILFKKNLDIKVKVGDQVYGAETILASYK